MRNTSAFRRGGPVSSLINAVFAIAACAISMALGQAAVFELVGIAEANDRIQATELYGAWVRWLVYPVAGLIGGFAVRLMKFDQPSASLVALLSTAPLWVVAWPIQDFDGVRLFQVVITLLCAVAPTLIPRRGASQRNTTASAG